MEALSSPALTADPLAWSRQWPQYNLLLQLTQSCAMSGRPEVCHRLLKRLLDVRERTRGAPPLVETLLNEMWYSVTLAARGDCTGAARHAEEARWKAQRVEGLLRQTLSAEARQHRLQLRGRSIQLQAKVRELVHRSELLLSLSHAAKIRAAAISRA
jgi:hypothetical protein